MDKETKLLEKKTHIIEALKRCLDRNVYSNITVQEVADEAGFSKGGLLHYFQSKEDMYLELIRQMFDGIRNDHALLLTGNLEVNEQASISALYGIEKFFLDRTTTKIFLNLILYSFEDEKIMKQLSTFFHQHFEFYKTIIDNSQKTHPKNRKSDLDPAIAARIAQIVIVSAGLFESVDAMNIDHTHLVRYILGLLKG